ncbi:hypothetical protein G9A89_020882 [Geosiphon pyriformis]|nr:hypothetical protein G9A89_020882 [Geosiphon pyriformis]
MDLFRYLNSVAILQTLSLLQQGISAPVFQNLVENNLRHSEFEFCSAIIKTPDTFSSPIDFSIGAISYSYPPYKDTDISLFGTEPENFTTISDVQSSLDENPTITYGNIEQEIESIPVEEPTLISNIGINADQSLVTQPIAFETQRAPYFDTCSLEKSWGLSFDDGPFRWSHKVLDTLEEAGVKATFFINGNNWNCIYNYASVLIRAYKSGHQIALHSWSHPDMRQITAAEIKYQVLYLEDALRKILRVVPRYFRLPYGRGSQSDLVLKTLGQIGYTVIGWDVDSGDANGFSNQKQKDVFRTAVLKGKPYISLRHDVKRTTSEIVVPYAVNLIKEAGYKIMLIAACLGDNDPSNWYKEVGEPQKRDDSWRCGVNDVHLFYGGFKCREIQF